MQVAEWGAYFKRYLGKQFQDAYLLGLGGPMQDGDELYNLVSSKGRGLYYKNEKVDALFDAGRSTMDPAKRRKIYARPRARPWSRTPRGSSCMQQVDIYAMRDRVTWTPRGDQWMPLHEAIAQVAGADRPANRGSAGIAQKEGDSLLVREIPSRSGANPPTYPRAAHGSCALSRVSIRIQLSCQRSSAVTVGNR